MKVEVSFFRKFTSVINWKDGNEVNCNFKGLQKKLEDQKFIDSFDIEEGALIDPEELVDAGGVFGPFSFVVVQEDPFKKCVSLLKRIESFCEENPDVLDGKLIQSISEVLEEVDENS